MIAIWEFAGTLDEARAFAHAVQIRAFKIGLPDQAQEIGS